jgi:glycine betaine/proline transport system permease protein
MTTDTQEISAFVSRNESYYRAAFGLLENKTRYFRPNSGAFFAGSLWAAARGVWWLFWLCLAFDISAISVFLNAFGDENIRVEFMVSGLMILVFTRLGVSMIADRALLKRFGKWRVNTRTTHGFSWRRVLVGTLLGLAIAPLTIYRTLRVAPTERDCRRLFASLKEASQTPDALQYFDCLTISAVPIDRGRPQFIAESIDRGVEYLVVNFSGLFDSIAWAVRTILVGLENLFIGIPWPVMIVMLVLISWRMAGIKIAIFTICAVGYLASMGFWQNAMATISLVFAAVAIAVVFGVPLGILAAKHKRAHAVVRPLLDMMQTLPSFVYLIPAIAFFSIGKTPAVLATVIYACPPLVRLTTLGIRQVPSTVTEAAVAFGATPLQLLLKIELPLAIPSIMTGINQSIMMSLAMSVIAALIGAGGLGFDVLFALQQVQPGKGLLAGIAIALCAMIIDRSVQGMRLAGNR